MRPLARLRLGAAIAAMLPLAIAHGQTLGPASLFTAIPPRYPASPLGGGPCRAQGTTSIGPVTCTAPGVSMTGSGSASVRGTFGAAASIDVTNLPVVWNPPQFGGLGLDAFAQGSLIDVLSFAPPGGATSPLTVTYRMQADGSSSASSPLDAYGQFGFTYWPVGSPNLAVQTAVYLRGPNASSTTDLLATVAPNTAYFFNFYLLAVAGAGDLTPPNVPITGSAVADFASTMRIVGYAVHDASGADITRQTTVSSAIGTSFAMLPEPTSIALVATGLALGALLRRRARR